MFGNTGEISTTTMPTPMSDGETVNEQSTKDAVDLYLGHMKVKIPPEINKQFVRNSECDICNYLFAEYMRCKCSISFCGNCAKIEQVKGVAIIKCPNAGFNSIHDFSVNDDYRENVYIRDSLNIPCPLSHGGRVDIHGPSAEGSGVEKKRYETQACSENKEVYTMRFLRNILEHVEYDHLPEEAKKFLNSSKESVMTNISDNDELNKIIQHNKVVKMVNRMKIAAKDKFDDSQYPSTSGASASIISEPAVKYIKCSGEIKQPTDQGSIEINKFYEVFTTLSHKEKVKEKVRIARILDNTDKEGVNNYFDEISTLCGNDSRNALMIDFPKCQDLVLNEVGPIARPVSFCRDDKGFMQRPISFHDDDPRMIYYIRSIYFLISPDHLVTLCRLWGVNVKSCRSFINFISHIMDKKKTLEQLRKLIQRRDSNLNSMFDEAVDYREVILTSELSKNKKTSDLIRQSYKQLSNKYNSEVLSEMLVDILDFITQHGGSEKLLYLTHRLFDLSFPYNKKVIDKARSLSTCRNPTETTSDLIDEIIEKIKTSPIVPISIIFEVIEEMGLGGVLPTVKKHIDKLTESQC